MAASRTRRKTPLHHKIFIGLAVGLAFGLVANLFWGESATLAWLIRNLIAPVGQLFLRIIFMAVIPLIFSALVLGVAELGDIRQLGRIGARTLGFTFVVTLISVIIGLTLVNWIKPGAGLSEAERQLLAGSLSTATVDQAVKSAAEAKTVVQTLLDLIPRNPLADAVGAFDENYRGGGILAVMVFSLFVGLALALARSERTATFERFLEGLYDVVMKIIQMGMKLAPVGVACLVFSVVARLGMEVVLILGKYVAVVLAGLLLHMLGVYSLLLKYIVRVNPWQFFSRIREVILTAFSTSSSNVTLPTALRAADEGLGIPRNIGNFVLTLGSTANQNGTALYEGVTVLFLAQFFGIELTLMQQFTVVLASVLAGIGTAGVPGGSLPVIVLVLQSVGVPGEGIGVILGVDRILDMSRTVINVTGDLTAAMYVAKSEGHEFDLAAAE